MSKVAVNRTNWALIDRKKNAFVHDPKTGALVFSSRNLARKTQRRLSGSPVVVKVDVDNPRTR